MSDHNINPDLPLRGHACHYDATKPVAEQLDAAAAQSGEAFGAVLNGFIGALADYTNCSGARADLGDDE